jgi:hypothetical protein
VKLVVIGAHRGAGDVVPPATTILAGDLVLSGLEVAEDQPLGDRDLLLRVAAVRAALLDRATFIAIRYGFAVHGESEALAKVAAHLPRWRELLDAHRDHVEMTLKVVAASSKPSVSAAGVSQEFSAAAEEAMGGVERRWAHRDQKSLEIAVLVARGDVPRVREAGEALKRAFPEVPFLLSGPWPLEVFAEES